MNLKQSGDLITIKYITQQEWYMWLHICENLYVCTYHKLQLELIHNKLYFVNDKYTKYQIKHIT